MGWQTANEQEGLIVKLASEAARPGVNPGGKLWKGILRSGGDGFVESLDAKLLSAFVGNFEDPVGGDNEKITGGCVQGEALEVRERYEANRKLRFFKLRDALRGCVPVNDRRAGGQGTEDVAVGAETKAGECGECGGLLHLRKDRVETIEQERHGQPWLALCCVKDCRSDRCLEAAHPH